MSFDAWPLNTYFSSSYIEGRQKFLSACKRHDLQVASCSHPDEKGPNGEDLAIDYVWVGPADAAKVLVITCGTHGLEAATGSATIVQWLASDALSTLPDGLAVLIIHGVNPYGWAYDSRGNEHGIDLNRNCLDHNLPHPENPDYDQLHKQITEAKINPEGLAEFITFFRNYEKQYGTARAISGITAGQYNHPSGIGYGGAQLSWSVRSVYAIARECLTQAKKVIMLDWHTGIGEFGKPFFIMDDKMTSPEYARAEQWWSPHAIHCDDILDGSNPDYSGLLIKGLKAEISKINDAEITSVVTEWGTYKTEAMLQSLLMDWWLHHNRISANPVVVENVRTRLVERFYPSVPEWQNAILEQAPEIYRKSIAGLASW
ncbi:MAG: DUF2817 domain-containing protein [Parvularculaceae bacterium]